MNKLYSVIVTTIACCMLQIHAMEYSNRVKEIRNRTFLKRGLEVHYEKRLQGVLELCYYINVQQRTILREISYYNQLDLDVIDTLYSLVYIHHRINGLIMEMCKIDESKTVPMLQDKYDTVLQLDLKEIVLNLKQKNDAVEKKFSECIEKDKAWKQHNTITISDISDISSISMHNMLDFVARNKVLLEKNYDYGFCAYRTFYDANNILLGMYIIKWNEDHEEYKTKYKNILDEYSSIVSRTIHVRDMLLQKLLGVQLVPT